MFRKLDAFLEHQMSRLSYDECRTITWSVLIVCWTLMLLNVIFFHNTYLALFYIGVLVLDIIFILLNYVYKVLR